MPINLLQQIVKQSFSSNQPELAKPIPDVNDAIEGFWVVRPGEIEQHALLFNDGNPVMIFLLDLQTQMMISAGGHTINPGTAWLSSQLLENVYIHTDTSAGLLVVRFKPASFYSMFHVDPLKIRRQPIWKLEDALGPAGTQILEAVASKCSIEDKVKAIKEVVDQYPQDNQANPLLNDAIAKITQTKGCITVAALVKSMNINYKWLERSFARNLGISPKDYIILQRFIHAHERLASQTDISLLQIAVANGYYDQTHLNKEFKRFTGKPPLAR